ncbi:MAG TPA: type II toxin-antitoxin system VapC family toxin [Chitinophagales bacterium]|nr:type II toxin-antitoxin system VapC family toxin [Chitinophagales bacterium]
MGTATKQAILKMNYLLDTNVVINYLDGSLPVSGMQLLNTIVDDAPMISIITKMETLGYNFTSIDEQTTLETFINGSTILDLNNDIVNKTIDIKKGKKIKLPDAIIAATAIVYDLVLVSRNISDFKNISGINVIDPHDLK